MIYACPSCGQKFKCDAAGVVQCPSCSAQVRVAEAAAHGTAWDRAAHGGWANAFFATVKGSIVDPVAFFESVGRGSGFMRPWAYAVIVTTIVFLVAAAYQAGFQALALSVNIASEVRHALFPLAALSIPLTIAAVAGFCIVAVPIFSTFVIFLQAAIYHLCLIILGAAKGDFWATFRTACYASGPQLFQIVPLLGGMVGPIWQLVLVVIGIKVVHKTTYSRSLLAVFLPTILCCGIVLLIAIAIFGGVIGALATHAH